MFKFSYVQSVAGKATVVDKDTFKKIITDTRVKAICNQIASTADTDTISRLKRGLPAFCWHAWFDDGKRKNYTAHPSGLIMIDIDHVDDPRKLWDEIKDQCLAYGALIAHVTPSTHGLRIVLPVPEGLDIEAAQTAYVKSLRLKDVDACTKDLARLSFCVPEEYFLHIDYKRLFEDVAETTPSLNIAPQAEVETPLIDASQKADVAEKDNALTNKTFDETFDTIPYPLLVESMQELLGGIPAHGSRNNFIFSMAAYLRYVCNDDPDWIATILPTYGESNDKWRRTIDSACQRAQYKVMPQIVKRAIELARHKMAVVSKNEDEDANQLPPPMPEKLPKLIAHLVKNVPVVCRPAVANAVFPALAAHLNGVKFWLIDGTEKEATFMCVTMAKQSSGKSAINKPIEYIVADIVERDEINRKREQEWKEASANKAGNKEKPKRPDDLCVQVLVSDMTNAAFVQRMKDANGKYLYTNLEELDLLKQLQTNGTKDVGKIICLCFDNGKYGQERVGTQSVTARVDLRWNWNASSTIQKGVQFFKGRMVDGTLSRVNFCTIIPDSSQPFVYGKYDDKYAETLKPYITNLNLANGNVECKQALDLARKMSDNCAEEGVLSDDDIYKDLSHRAVTIAYLKAMVLYIAQGMTWSKDIAEFAEWSLKYDLWCKCHFFGEQVKEEKAKENVKKKRGRQNLLELLPATFSFKDAQEMRLAQGLDDSGCRQMINSWTFRNYIELDNVTGMYIKTQQYLEKVRRG